MYLVNKDIEAMRDILNILRKDINAVTKGVVTPDDIKDNVKLQQSRVLKLIDEGYRGMLKSMPEWKHEVHRLMSAFFKVLRMLEGDYGDNGELLAACNALVDVTLMFIIWAEEEERKLKTIGFEMVRGALSNELAKLKFIIQEHRIGYDSQEWLKGLSFLVNGSTTMVIFRNISKDVDFVYDLFDKAVCSAELKEDVSSILWVYTSLGLLIEEIQKVYNTL